LIQDLALKWPITDKWDTKNKSWKEVKESMTEIIGADRNVGVFELPQKFHKHVSNVYSFALAFKNTLKYSTWVSKFENEQFNA
jgi:hypothetical protein